MKCPRGYICLSQRMGTPLLTGVLIAFIFITLMYLFNHTTKKIVKDTIKQFTKKKSVELERLNGNQPNREINVNFRNPISVKPEFGDDIANNPYIPPLKEHSGLPINMRTRGHPGNFQQMGVLTGQRNGKEVVLPLYGRQTYGGSDYYEYYTASEGYHSYKIPLVKGGRDCTDERGCKEIFDGDDVNVNTYDGSFKANIYKNSLPRYIPY
jgi:hypothetical protein